MSAMEAEYEQIKATIRKELKDEPEKLALAVAVVNIVQQLSRDIHAIADALKKMERNRG